MKGAKISLIILALIVITSFVYATDCDPEITLINQDPYPAVPGDSAKLVFQIDGLSGSECGDIGIELVEKYPISLDPSNPSRINIKAGTYTSSDYESFVMAPYTIRIAEDALDGDTPVELVLIRRGISVGYEFDVNIEDTKTEFEIYVKDYDYTTRELTFEILNIGESDIQALTLEIPKQENIEVKGPNKVIVGDLDSNEYTTADFEAILKDGQINLNLYYSDTINFRRTSYSNVDFDSAYFVNRVSDIKTISPWTYIIWAAVIILIIYFIFSKFKRKKKNNLK